MIFGSFKDPVQRRLAAQSGGVTPDTVLQWVIIRDRKSNKLIPKWCNLLPLLTWEKVKGCFLELFTKQFDIKDSINIKSYIRSYDKNIGKSSYSFISHSTVPSAKRRAKLSKNDETTGLILLSQIGT